MPVTQLKILASFFFSENENFQSYIACLHDQNKSDFFGGPAFIQPIRAI